MKSINRPTGWPRRLAEWEFARFIVAGGMNTVITYLIYLVALLVMPYAAAYTISFLSGIAISYYLNAEFVFRRKMSAGTALGYPLVYVCQYVAGLALLAVLVGRWHVDKRWAPAIVIPCIVPVTFVLAKLILKRAPRKA